MGIVGDLVEFSPSTTIVSDDVDQNFADLKAAINSALFVDVTRTITAHQRLANEVWLTGRNAANSGDVNMFSLNSSDLIQAGVAMRTQGVAPLTNSSSDLGLTGLRWARIFADVLILTTQTPASASDAGTAGQIAWDSGFLYVCVATNTWERVAIATW